LPSPPISYGDYFHGAVPGGLILDMQFDNLRRLASAYKSDDRLQGSVFELCVMGMSAYFEAFCKSHFASIVNICPHLLVRLESRGRDTHVNAAALVQAESTSQPMVGFLVADRLDLGSARSINSAFKDLLDVTFLTKGDVARFQQLCEDRNLLVHHGGIITHGFARDRRLKRHLYPHRVYFDSLQLSVDEVISYLLFLRTLSVKMRLVAAATVTKYVKAEHVRLRSGARHAIRAMQWVDDWTEAT
jgi:hypothetical protein